MAVSSLIVNLDSPTAEGGAETSPTSQLDLPLMALYSNLEVRGVDVEGILGRIRNFWGKFLFLGDILSFLRKFGENVCLLIFSPNGGHLGPRHNKNFLL